MIERMKATINLHHLITNIQAIQKKHPNKKIMAVVKADAYGLGACACAQALEEFVDSFAVAYVQEGIDLRKCGIQKDILILSYISETEISSLLSYDLIATVYDLDFASYLQQQIPFGEKLKIHIKIDSGMGRIGFLPSKELLSQISSTASMDRLEIDGIYTHFSSADTDKVYTNMQHRVFSDVIALLENEGIHFHRKHASNTAASIHFPDLPYDTLRIGLLMYGILPQENLQTVLSLKTLIAHIKNVEAKTYIGYSKQYQTKCKSRIATLPVGYADGIPRALGNCGRVLIGDYFAPIVGHVCMDQMMVDVTDIKGVEKLQEVILIGGQGNQQIFLQEWADHSQTIVYELMTRIGKRVPRIYSY